MDAAGDPLPPATLALCQKADAILFGAMGLPHVRGTDGTEIIPQLDLRFHFDLYAGVRPIRTFVGLPTPLSNPKAQDIDLVLVRESTEGLFYARGRGDVRTERGVETAVYDTMKITRHGTARICEFAFKLAERRAQTKGRAGRVTSARTLARRVPALISAAVPMLGIFPLLGMRFGQEKLCAAALLGGTVASFFTLSALVALLKAS